MNSKKRGKFIVFEGIDGAGKSTQAKLLYQFLKKEKRKVILTSEPTKGPIGKTLFIFLGKKEKLNALGLQLLFCADRAYHLEKVVLPYLKKGYDVISDRYFFSTIAYGLLEIKDFSWLYRLNEKFILPDITFLLDLSEKESLKRIKKDRDKSSLFEKEKILKEVRKNYLFLRKKFPNIFLLDARKSISDVFKEVKEILRLKYKRSK